MFYKIENINVELSQNVLNLIDKDEKNFKNQIKKLSEKIIAKQNVKLILVSGPSCAGKTTFSNILKDELSIKGYKTISIQMDNFFISRAKRKRLANGEEDFESTNIINFKLMKRCFKQLFKHKKAMFPIYDFEKCMSIEKQLKIEIDNKTFIIFEGLHALNPLVYSQFDTKDIYKVFISNENGFSFENKIISPREMRFIRRIVRDEEKRNTKAQETYKLWHNIIENEDKFVFPNKNVADFIVNSSYSYEIALYKQELAKIKKENSELFKQVPALNIAQKVKSLNKKYVPQNSLMWEFIQKN